MRIEDVIAAVCLVGGVVIITILVATSDWAKKYPLATPHVTRWLTNSATRYYYGTNELFIGFRDDGVVVWRKR